MKVRPANSPKPPARRIAGFTLIELMIAVVVVGLLAMVALPSFLDSIRKGRRSEAFAAISSIQQAQERWRSNNATYASSLSALNITPSTTASGNYALSTDVPASAAASTYTVTATGVAGTSQANDSCRNLSVQMASGVVTVAGCQSCTSFTYNATDPCWAK